MSDTLMAIIGIFLAVILMFIFPLMEIGGKNDEISQTVVQVVVSDFVNKVATQGKITEFDYDELVQKLNATGNSYDIQIEAKILDDNPMRSTTTGNSSLLGEYKYYSVYTNTILDEIAQNQEYLLKNDDYIVVTVKNTNITMGTQLKNFIYNLIGKDTYTIGTSASALVLNGGEQEAITGPMTANKITYPERSVKVKTKKKVTTTTTVGNNLDVVIILDCEHYTMPYHNNNGTSTEFVQNIINAVNGNGNYTFILTSDPTTVYSNPTTTTWIENATDDNTATSYVRAFQKAFQILESASGNRCIVFLSWQPDAEYLKNAINTLKSNQNKFDLFFTTYCCSDSHSDAQWHSAIATEKSGGNLGAGDIGTRFENLVSKTVTTEEWVDQPESNRASSELKIVLGNVDMTQEIGVKINNVPYTIGNNLPTYVVYFDRIKGEYVLDLKLVIELLDMTFEEWNNAEIELLYSQKN